MASTTSDTTPIAGKQTPPERIAQRRPYGFPVSRPTTAKADMPTQKTTRAQFLKKSLDSPVMPKPNQREQVERVESYRHPQRQRDGPRRRGLIHEQPPKPNDPTQQSAHPGFAAAQRRRTADPRNQATARNPRSERSRSAAAAAPSASELRGTSIAAAVCWSGWFG